MNRDYFNGRRHNRKQQFIELLGGKCERCGKKKNLQFDHKNPKRKEFRIADRLDAPEDVLKKEVRKCRLLCEKCHREKTREKWEFGGKPARHGSIWYYKSRGCRCYRCRKVMSEYNKARRAVLKEVAASCDQDAYQSPLNHFFSVHFFPVI